MIFFGPISRWLFLLTFLCLFTEVRGQESETPLFLQTRERNMFVMAHTRGFGLGYQQGYIKNIKTTLLWESSIATMRHPKEYRRTNESFPNARTYNYGKLNRVYMFRGGLGYARTLSEKPYWGGVKVRYHLLTGLNLAVTEPIYLLILYYNPDDGKYYPVPEPYDPDSHFSDNIFGRGPFGKGFKDARLYPGLYLKGGWHFDHADDYELLRALEVGFSIDFFPKKIPIMAFAHNANFFLTFSLSYHFGDRS